MPNRRCTPSTSTTPPGKGQEARPQTGRPNRGHALRQRPVRTPPLGTTTRPSANNHVHVVDNDQRIAILRVGPAHPDDRGPAVQFHIADHIGSSTVVVDDTGVLVNREEFTPYGETSFGSYTRKRYRYTGQERDEESGLAYHGARSFMAWTARWATCNAIGAAGGDRPVIYAAANPMTFADPAGTQPTDQQPDTEGNYWAPAETVAVSGTAPPDLLGSAVSRGLSKPIATRAQIAANITGNLDSFFPDWTPEGRPSESTRRQNPEAADATIQKRAGGIYDRVAADAVARLEKQQRVMAAALPFVGKALLYSAFVGGTAGLFGLAPASGTPAGEAFLGGGPGVYMGASGALGFYDEMEEAAALRSGEGNTHPTPPVVAGTIVSPIYRMPPDRHGVTRDFLVYETSAGRQPFYRSSGDNSGMAGRWLPFVAQSQQP